MTPLQRNLLTVFDGEGVRYLAIGGYGMRCHGFERNTFDIDLWVERSVKNAEKLARAIEVLAPGHIPSGTTWVDVFQREACLVEYPSIGPAKEVDLLTGVGPLVFNDCYARSFLTKVDGTALRTLCIQDLLETKKLALKLGTDPRGRSVDQADYEYLVGRLAAAKPNNAPHLDVPREAQPAGERGH